MRLFAGLLLALALSSGVSAAVTSTNAYVLTDSTGKRVGQPLADLKTCQDAADSQAAGGYECFAVVRLTVTKPPIDNTWIQCPEYWQGATCRFVGTRKVRYGTTDGRYNEKVFTNSAVCTDAVFGDPAYGVPKTCSYSATQTTPVDPDRPTNYTKTQIFAMPVSPVQGEGQDINLRFRFFGVETPWPLMKPSLQFYRNGVLVLDGGGAGNHYWQFEVNTSDWTGKYIEYQYKYNLTKGNLTPGVYELYITIYEGVPPYTYIPSLVECNGIQMKNYACRVGTFTVVASSLPPSTDLTKSQGMTKTPHTPW